MHVAKQDHIFRLLPLAGIRERVTKVRGGQAALAIVVILVIGRMIIRPMFRFVGSDASREMYLATVLLVIIGTAIATERAGMSMALGACSPASWS